MLTIILRGPQGCGKSRVATLLKSYLPLMGIRFVIHEEQTE
jgi:dephospho-CoA kinase